MQEIPQQKTSAQQNYPTRPSRRHHACTASTLVPASTTATATATATTIVATIVAIAMMLLRWFSRLGARGFHDHE
jgi:hypothetical protein